MSKFLEALEVFNAMVEDGEHQMECSFEELLNNMPVKKGKETIREALQMAHDEGWQPIENMPKEHEHIVVWVEYKYRSGSGHPKEAFVFKSKIEIDGFLDWDYKHKEVTHWKPLVRHTPPKESK